MQYIFLSALFVANEKPDLMLYYCIGAAYRSRFGSVTKSKCAKAILMRMRSLARKRCSVKINPAARVHVYYTKTPMCELQETVKESPEAVRTGGEVRTYSIFVESLRHAPAH